MLTSLALIFLVGLAMASICQKIKLPRIIGMLITGVILIKAGLSLNISDLKKVGRPAVLMSFLPAVFEILAFILFAPSVLEITLIDAAIMGAVLGAVSPAVVVPRMVQLMETKYVHRHYVRNGMKVISSSF